MQKGLLFVDYKDIAQVRYREESGFISYYNIELVSLDTSHCTLEVSLQQGQRLHRTRVDRQHPYPPTQPVLTRKNWYGVTVRFGTAMKAFLSSFIRQQYVLLKS